jgi:hypothetical protein
MGACIVPTYHIYKLSSDNQIVGTSETVDFDSDRDVIAYAKTKMDGLDLEVWDGPRVVVRLKSTDQ